MYIGSYMPISSKTFAQTLSNAQHLHKLVMQHSSSIMPYLETLRASPDNTVPFPQLRRIELHHRASFITGGIDGGVIYEILKGRREKGSILEWFEVDGGYEVFFPTSDIRTRLAELVDHLRLPP